MRCLLTLALLLATPIFAADIDGRWTGSIDGGNGPMHMIYHFKADGATLTGSTGPEGMEVKISDGKIDGDDIAFNLKLDSGGNAITVACRGVLSGSDLLMELDFMGKRLQLLLKRD
jgi:hypothetical protein